MTSNFDRMRADHDRRRRDFDRQFKRASRFVGVAWVIGSLVSVTIVGVVLWAIIRIVQHYT